MRDLLCLSAIAATLVGCAHGHHGTPRSPERPTPPRICQEIDVAEPVDPEEACPAWRRVALKRDPQGACPDPGAVDGNEWQVEHLFAADSTSASPSTAEHAAALPPALRPFCLYEYQKNEPEVLARLNENLDRLIGSKSALTRADNACAAVGPAEGGGPPALLETWEELEEFFLEQVGDVEPVTVLGAPDVERDQEEPRVRLSFLDTQPVDSWDHDVNSRHGFALAELARKIVCDETPESRCTAEIDSRLALPIERFTRDNPADTSMNWELGGYSGSVDFLATAVWDAVRGQERRPRQHLVLNLSVAWDGAVFGGLEDRIEDMPATVQALYRALEVASCRGALVVAAAGNRKEGPAEENGPLLPGGWEGRDAPDAGTCRVILGLEPAGSHPPGASSEPLVYAAGGVRFDNSPLYNSRPGSTPPRVAYASHALAVPSERILSRPNAKAPKPLTGTSVATAVISAAASVVWHHWPQLTRAELMDMLYQAGVPLEETADFYHASFGDSPEVRRVAVCAALERACAELGGACPPACQDLPSEPPSWCWSEGSCSKPMKTIDASKIDQQLADILFCGDRKILYDSAMGIPADPCLSRQFYDVGAWAWQESALPQPEEDPCAACGPSGGSKGGLVGVLATGTECGTPGGRSLLIEIDREWERTLSQAFLDVGDYSLALGVGELAGGDCVLVENIDLDRFADLDENPYVILRFRTGDRQGISVPLQF